MLPEDNDRDLDRDRHRDQKTVRRKDCTDRLSEEQIDLHHTYIHKSRRTDRQTDRWTQGDNQSINQAGRQAPCCKGSESGWKKETEGDKEEEKEQR